MNVHIIHAILYNHDHDLLIYDAIHKRNNEVKKELQKLLEDSNGLPEKLFST